MFCLCCLCCLCWITGPGDTGKEGQSEDVDVSQHIEFVEDRCFNDVRYNIDSTRLLALGWKEETTFQQGIANTVQWYTMKNEDGTMVECWPKHLIEQATVAHPRMMGKEASFGVL